MKKVLESFNVLKTRPEHNINATFYRAVFIQGRNHFRVGTVESVFLKLQVVTCMNIFIQGSSHLNVPSVPKHSFNVKT